MTDHLQIPTLYAFASIGLLCGVIALLLSLLTYMTSRRNLRYLKTIHQGIELLLAGQDKATAEQIQIKAWMEKSLRELEHDHDKFKDAVEGLTQSLKRIEGIGRNVLDNQHNHIIKNNTTTGSSNNKIKVNTPQKAPDMYEGHLVNTLLKQLVDKMQDLSDKVPPKEQ